ncbi:hypothetical protein C8R47DRAFT_1205379 [Mycena vitilis]|nr:hypothetical protein C8R47DRAFT_1205379 [Mycena vitilis]
MPPRRRKQSKLTDVDEIDDDRVSTGTGYIDDDEEMVNTQRQDRDWAPSSEDDRTDFTGSAGGSRPASPTAPTGSTLLSHQQTGSAAVASSSSAPAQTPVFPSHNRSMVEQTKVTYNRATGALAAASSAPAALNAAPVLPAPPAAGPPPAAVAAAPTVASAPAPAAAPSVPAAVVTPVSATAKRGPGRPKKAKSVTRAQSSASLAEDGAKNPGKNTVRYGLQQLEATKEEMRVVTGNLVDRVNDASTTAESARVEIDSLRATLHKLEQEMAALRAERDNVFDTGSESGESPVRTTGNKRKGRSPAGRQTGAWYPSSAATPRSPRCSPYPHLPSASFTNQITVRAGPALLLALALQIPGYCGPWKIPHHRDIGPQLDRLLVPRPPSLPQKIEFQYLAVGSPAVHPQAARDPLPHPQLLCCTLPPSPPGACPLPARRLPASRPALARFPPGACLPASRLALARLPAR